MQAKPRALTSIMLNFINTISFILLDTTVVGPAQPEEDPPKDHTKEDNTMKTKTEDLTEVGLEDQGLVMTKRTYTKRTDRLPEIL